MTQPMSDHAQRRLARIAARIEATFPHLATKADVTDVKWMLGYLGLVMLGGFGFLIHLIAAM